ncbi:MAG: Tyrosine recombinase XerD [Bacteroidetes bacterium ADurb.BinA245]|jgi:site-specific recombinase XerD|nr:site-specific integrase [Chitinophagaceae bacterium]OPZ16219.1 MAG: Tyrosine recombinase XerD [Bacteroidetes bacterium ADurb.BinA245]
MQSNLSFLFYLKKPKGYVSGPAPIYLRLTVSGQRAEMSTGKECLPERWNSVAGLAKGNTEEVKSLNAYLSILQGKLHQYHNQLLATGETITAETLKNKVSGKSERARSLVKIFQDHNNQIETLLNDEFAPGTLERYKTSLKHTVNFLKWKFRVSDIDIRRIDHAFITEYEFYLRSVRKCNNNTAVKYIKNFGKIIRICIANGWLDKNPFSNYKSKVKEVERAFLVEEEMQVLASKEFVTERLNQVKDIFLFSCFTGLAYIDVKKLTKNNITIGIDGEKWIYTNRQKTDTRSNIPLLPMAEEIIAKYKEHPQCLNEGKLLPVLSNQKMNAYLKEMADVCGINKELTFHIARHTFATTVTLTNGVPIESVSKMLGHKNLRTTQHYAKILDRKVSDDMKMLRSKLSTGSFSTGEKKTGS